MADKPIDINRVKATVHPNTGGIAVDVPLMIKGKRHNVRLGLNLLSAPVKALDDSEDTLLHLEAAMRTAFVEDVSICDGKGKHVTTDKLSAAMADLIELKMEESR